MNPQVSYEVQARGNGVWETFRFETAAQAERWARTLSCHWRIVVVRVTRKVVKTCKKR